MDMLKNNIVDYDLSRYLKNLYIVHSTSILIIKLRILQQAVGSSIKKYIYKKKK